MHAGTRPSSHLGLGLLGEAHVVDRDCVTPGKVLTSPGQERLSEKETRHPENWRWFIAQPPVGARRYARVNRGCE